MAVLPCKCGGAAMALNYMSTQLVDALKVAREYFGPEAEHWLDDEVVHRLMIRALDLQRQLDEARHDRPPRGITTK